MRNRTYPKYKASGVEWIGDIPEHWHIRRLKTLASYRVSSVDKVAAEGEMSVRLCNYTDVYYNDEIRMGMQFMETTASTEEISRFHLEIGDVLITKDSEEWRDIGIPAIVMESAPDLVCGYHLAMIRPGDRYVLGPFVFRALQSTAVNRQFQVASSGVTRFGLPKSAIGEAWVAVPPLGEQGAIATFLDRETKGIDALIAKKRTLIERLKEERAALVSLVVTRGLPPEAARAAGLDPSPRLKHSGVEWIGETPEHWTLKPLMHLTDLSRQIMYGIVLPGPDVDDGVPIVKGGDVKPGHLVLERLCRTTREIEAGYARSRLEGGDIVFSIRGTVGEAELVPGEITGANLTQDAARIAVGRSTESSWLLFALKARAIVDPLLALSLGAAVRGVNIRDLKRIRVPVPPQDEQRAIADYLNRETLRIDDLAARVEAAIERLQEYRSALITAAVTGKIDVRGRSSALLPAADPLPVAVDIPNTV